MKNLNFFLLAILILPFTGFAQRIGDGFPGAGNAFSAENYGEDIMKHLVDAEQLIRRYRWEEAVLAYDRAIAQDPWFSDAYLKRAILLQKLGRTTEASRDLQMANRLNPYIADLYGFNGRQGQLAQLAYAPQEYLGALQSADAAGSDFLRNSLQCKLAGDWACAEADIEKALALHQQPDPPLLNIRGNLFVIFGKYFRAIEEYTRAIQQDPDNAQAYYNRGLAHFLTLNRVSACFDLERSAELGYDKALERLPYLCQQ